MMTVVWGGGCSGRKLGKVLHAFWKLKRDLNSPVDRNSHGSREESIVLF